MTHENDAIKNLPESLPDDLKAVLELQKGHSTIWINAINTGGGIGLYLALLCIGKFEINQTVSTYLIILAFIHFFLITNLSEVDKRSQKQINLLKTVVLKLHEESLQKKKNAAL